MRKRSASYGVRQRGGARGAARTMPLWLWAATLLAAAGAGASTTRRLQLLGWQLELHENRAIRSPYYNECQFYKGRVVDEEGSSATVTDCDGQLYGLLQVGGEEFVLQPTRSDRSHVLRRRDVELSEKATAYNLTGDTVTDLELDFGEEDDPVPVPHVRPRHSGRYSEVEYFRGVQTFSRPLSGVKGLWLEMAIVADHTMIKFHGKERVTHYILALMNIVSAIFNDPSLNSNMTLVINKLFLIEEKDYVIKNGNVKKSLEAVNKWNYKHLKQLSEGSTGWDATVWLTRSQLGGPSGFAPVGGVCSRARSAAIDRDEGLTSAFVIAHELAHLLGLTHDGDSQCQSEAVKGSVMAPTVLATLHNYAWSSCSKEQFHEKSKRWWCLHERSKDDGVELGGAKELSNYVFTMDEQCRTEFGEGFSVCKSVKVRAACSRLWCAHRAMPHVCRSKRAPPLEGTPCGHNKWCVDRICEPMPGHVIKTEADRRNTEVDNTLDREERPEWSEWGAWSECSAECGYGLRTRVRRCRYKGMTSESACEGAGSQVRTCWAGAACAATRDPRADLCTRQHNRFIPYVHPNQTQECEIWCVDYGGGGPSNFGSLPDGTSCSYNRPYDVCFQGTCVKGQCNSSDTICNWCPDGYCNNNTHIYTRSLGTGKGWSRLTVIPHDAHQLSVHIATPVPLNIALRERRRDKLVLELRKHSKPYDIKQDKYLKYDPNVPQNLQIIEVDSNVIDIKEGSGSEGSVVAAGTLLRWTQTDTDVFISSESRLQTDLMISAIAEHPAMSGKLVSVEVSVNYSTPASRTKPMEIRWSTERGPCSSSCGGGFRVVRPRCLRDHKCAPVMFEACNIHSCEFSWAGGEWEECSATCGADGLQQRQLYCVPVNATTSSRRELIKNSVSPSLCPSQKPATQQACNRLPCPVYWREMPWTECSTTCGRGVSRRPLVCPSPDAHLCGPKPRERHRRCRVRACPRRAPPSPAAPAACPPRHTAQYCELFDTEQLRRHCQLTPFRNYCCTACRDIDRYYRGHG
ncbi:unnamed protein product [Chrysodeixis includens]|uniref:Peptidase M12B domain-containing protein n=1 Tax=Chrysodeixis includens TaxID=689277 RepID=A0A9P0BVE5_CHRIL|nr:unnamed protein product [Chrysodeixis includens]